MTDVLSLKKANCKNCHKCIRSCPVKSIRFADNQAKIIPEECILCGRCVVVCPQNAKRVRSDLTEVIGAVGSGQAGHRDARPLVYQRVPRLGDRGDGGLPQKARAVRRAGDRRGRLYRQERI